MNVILPPFSTVVVVVNAILNEPEAAVPTFAASAAVVAVALVTATVPPMDGSVPIPVVDDASKVTPLLVVITEKAPCGCAPPKVHVLSVRTREYEPGARFAVPKVQVKVSITAALLQVAAAPGPRDKEHVDVGTGDVPVRVAAVAVKM